MNNYIRYYDERFGDVYEIFTDHDGNFLVAQRSMESIGNNPVIYYDLDKVPQAHKTAIEQLLVERKKLL